MVLERGENRKKPKPIGQASPTAMVKCEPLEGEPRAEEQEEGEVGRGGGAGVVQAIMEVMEERSLDLRIGCALFTCRACLDPLKPPTFKCEAGHVLCGSCQVSHDQACGCATTYVACLDVDAFVHDAKVPCLHYHWGVGATSSTTTPRTTSAMPR
ncbi:E3 ubiquitin-protein ligase SINA-like 5 [Panicum miliaceum]|uniref:E3 ubiquitin-protein ligase SINA-like 5 n=1 Tax=Panicum miliaceum TaxID=4540 RepID=A0A3L6Q585_PANMI|nr:E3 ubiquitin-protein ligase SINA-like 5 [Panicum miliaceum]